MNGNKAKAARATKTLHKLRRKNTNLIAKGFSAGVDSLKAMGFIKRFRILFL